MVHNILRLGGLVRLRWPGGAPPPLWSVVGAVCLAAIFGTGSAAAQGAGLFVDAEPESAHPRVNAPDAPTAVGVAAQRQRAVRVDATRLAAARAAVERDGASRLTLNLFDDILLVAVIDQIAATSAGYSLSGRIDGEESSSMVLVVNGDVIAGEVSTLTGTYTLRTARDGTRVIRQLDPSTFPPEAPERQPPPSSARDRPGAGPILSADHARAAPGLVSAPLAVDASSAGPEDGSVIDILVAYTQAARTAEGGRDQIGALIDLMIAQTNLAFRYSGVITQLNLVHTAEVDYSVAEHPDVSLIYALEDPSDGHLDELHTMRDRHAADLVALIVTHPYPYGGEANAWWWHPHLEDTDPSRIAFSVTRSDVGPAFIHEIGHNLGVHHDRYAEIHACCTARDGGTRWNRPHPWSYGYVNQRAFEPGAPTSSRWGTIMSFGTQLQDAGFRHHHLSRFSNPDLSYRGDPMGDPGTAPSSDPIGPADARRTINETRVTVANFRIAPCPGGGQDGAVCDRKALEALYDATGGWNWTNTANWRTDAPLGRWHGVRTDSSGRVTRLDLAANGLIGRVPLDITNLSRLTHFDISGTAACIPTEVAFRTWRRNVSTVRGSTCIDPLTADRGALEALFDSTGGVDWTDRTNWKTDAPLDQWYGVETHGLRVSGLGLGGYDETARRHVGNGLAGSLPAELGALTDLRWLGIVGNPSLTGPLPAELGNLTNLTYLNIEVNSLTGTIPVELANLKSLNRLNLLANRLTGGIPAELGTLTDLVDLWLGHNELTGPVPAALGGLVNLRTLNLSSNQFTGPIPAVLGNLASLQRLDLGGNRLTGPIPRSLTRLSMLEFLDISNTRVCVPDDAAVQAWLATIADFRTSGLACGPRNRPPEAVGTLAPLTIGIDEAAVTVEVSGVFRDPDGDRLTFGASSSAPSVVTVGVSGSQVTLRPLAEGTALVTVTAADTDGSNTMASQSFAVTVYRAFTDHPIVPGVTPVRAVHFRELRARIDGVRMMRGLAGFAWTDPVLTAGVTPVRLVHLGELRSALAESYEAAGRPTPDWTDSATAVEAIPIRAAHLMELRAAVLALEE